MGSANVGEKSMGIVKEMTTAHNHRRIVIARQGPLESGSLVAETVDVSCI